MPEWMAFNVADYVSNTLHLTTRQHGAYILVICAAWSGKGILPGSDQALMSIAKLSQEQWQEDGTAIKALLTKRGDVWVHERVEFEWNDSQALIAAKQKAGKEGARKRWHGRGNGKAMAEPSQTQRQTDAPLQIPSSVSKDTGADAASVVFNQGLAWLMKSTGKTEDNCRSQLGKWRKAIGDEALIAALGRGQREGPIDAMAWMERAITAKPPAQKREDVAGATVDRDSPEQWAARMKGYKPGVPWWNRHEWGPPPGESGCRVPKHMIATGGTA